MSAPTCFVNATLQALRHWPALRNTARNSDTELGRLLTAVLDALDAGEAGEAMRPTLERLATVIVEMTDMDVSQ